MFFVKNTTVNPLRKKKNLIMVTGLTVLFEFCYLKHCRFSREKGNYSPFWGVLPFLLWKKNSSLIVCFQKKKKNNFY